MKKQMIKIVAVIALIATAGWNITQSEKEGALSDLALENIDALAQGESELPEECEAVMESSCCVIGDVHHTWCKGVGSGADTRRCTSHSY